MSSNNNSSSSRGTSDLRLSAPEFVLPSSMRTQKDSNKIVLGDDTAAETNLSVTAAEFVPSDSFVSPSCSTSVLNSGDEPVFRPKNTRTEALGTLNVAAKRFVPSFQVHGDAATMPPPSPGGTRQDPTFYQRSPVQKQKPLCRFFQQGACRRGLQCSFSHDVSRLATGTLGSGDIEDDGLTRGDSGLATVNIGRAADGAFIVVDEGIRCQFGPGAKVIDLKLGSANETSTEQSTRMLISGLGPAISDFDLEVMVSKFGTIQSMNRRHSSYAFCTYGTNQSAKDAVHSLSGTSQSSWIGLAAKGENTNGTVDATKRDSKFVSVVLVAEEGLVSSPRNATVKLQWYAPSRVAWLHFRQRPWAEKAATTLHSKTFDKRTLSAKFQPPSYRQTRSFSVWVGGLGGYVKQDQLRQFVRKYSGTKMPESILMEEPTFCDEDGPQIVRQLLLSKGGPLIRFDEDGDNHLPHVLKRKALAKFAKAEDAARACAYFRTNTRVRGLGDTRVFCQRVYSAKFTLPGSVFLVVRDELQRVIKKQQAIHHDIRFTIFENANMTTSLLLQADDAKHLAVTKCRITPILDGELILDPCCKQEQKVPFWKEFFASKQVAKQATRRISRHFGNADVSVLFNTRRREVRLFAKSFLRDPATTHVVNELSALKPDSHSVPIDLDQYTFLLNGGRATLDQLIVACHAPSVSLDIKNRALLVEGTATDAKKSVAFLTRLMCKDEPGTASEEESPCPVCFCVPDEDEPTVQLSCMHRYCRDCFLAWLCSGTQTCDFPIQCLAEGCAREAELDELDRALPRPDFLSLLRSAVDKHVMANQCKYQFCLSPGCSGIFAHPENALDTTGSHEQRTATCSTCQMTVCTQCKVQEHEGLTCQQYMLAKMPPNRLRNHIVEEILTLKCPRCPQAFLAFDGCFALKCSSCPCAFCGWCIADCGSDAHAHVKSCREKLPEAKHETYYGTFPQFEKAQRIRRRKRLISFLQTLGTKEEQHATLACIEQDLKDLHLHDINIGSLN